MSYIFNNYFKYLINLVFFMNYLYMMYFSVSITIILLNIIRY